ncbi:hypothetical protein [Pseudodesulfovibrio sp. JC047]|uniref:hypothetical protein n=1 Tax=Pseudodesulfovibrio sp. JC047 TaxID=2683199 RepID=UPI001EF2FA78|nr:hypothetical protein [Pseudodesulfovibrio sp. JC047]
MTHFFKDDTKDDWFLPADIRTQLTETFKTLQGTVSLEVFTQPGINDEFSEYTAQFCWDLGRISDKILVTGHELDSDRARELGITASPTLCVNPDNVHIRFLGAPLGEEGKAFITAIMLASLGMSGLSETSVPLLEPLSKERLVQVFVSPT